MPKNITLSITDAVASLMEAMPDVNWSAVAKACIKQYIEVRRNPDMSSLLEKLQKEKGEEYVNGRKKADEIAHDFGYKGLSILMRKYYDKRQEVDEKAMTGQEAPWESLPSREETIQSLLMENGYIKNELSEEFLKGLMERLLEIEKALSK
jgi:hypothetical protein